MAGFLGFLTHIWVWCLRLFGQQPRTQGSSSPDDATISTTGQLEMWNVRDVSANLVEFVATHGDFYRDMSARHGSPNYKLHWHVMSGSGFYHDSVGKNILLERLFYSLDPGKGHRTIIDKSFIAYTPWDANWTMPLAPTQILHVNETAGSIYFDDLTTRTRPMEGPEDTRVIFNPEKETVHLNFNMMTPNGDRQMFAQSVWMNVTSDDYEYRKTEPLVQFEHEKGFRAQTEKNWVPIIIQGHVHYLYSLAPLRIILCEREGTSHDAFEKRDEKNDVTSYKKRCHVKYKGDPVSVGSQMSALRSGTNWVEFSPGVYFSFARTSIRYEKCAYAIYRPNLVVLKFNIRPENGEYVDPRIIYVSEPIVRFDSRIFALYDQEGLSNGDKCDDRAVLIPGSIPRWTGMENGDSTDVIFCVNDDMTVLAQMHGVGATVQAALDAEPSLKQSLAMTRKGTLAARAEKETRRFAEKSFIRRAKSHGKK